MERPECTLRDLISRRLKDKRNFSEEELFAFLAKVVASLIYIQDNGLKNIQIDSETIVQCGENVKVMDCGVAASKTYYQLLERREKGLSCPVNNIYLAPELLKVTIVPLRNWRNSTTIPTSRLRLTSSPSA